MCCSVLQCVAVCCRVSHKGFMRLQGTSYLFDKEKDGVCVRVCVCMCRRETGVCVCACLCVYV